MIANAMKTRAALVTGISSGLIGYAVGNYLGIAMAKLLPTISNWIQSF
jgi:uncharacterized membrane protein